jgi:hypothetical protein
MGMLDKEEGVGIYNKSAGFATTVVCMLGGGGPN